MNVLITGARGLLGKEFVQLFSERGYDVIATDLPEHNVTSPEAWDEIARRHVIDILINNAGITNNTKAAGFKDTFGAWEDILSVNLTGTMLGCKIIGWQMIERGGGCIINIASQYGIVSPHHDIYAGTGIYQPAAYSVSKAGVIGLTRYLACLWGRFGVRVNCISPGGVITGALAKYEQDFVNRLEKQNPMKRMAHPDEIVGAAMYLAEASYVNGANIVVDGGYTCW